MSGGCLIGRSQAARIDRLINKKYKLISLKFATSPPKLQPEPSLRDEICRSAAFSAPTVAVPHAYLYVLGLLTAIFGAFIAWRLWLPLEISGNEPWNAYHIQDAFSPQQLYPPPETMISNYTPLSYYALNVISPLFPSSIVAGRVVSLFSILFISLMSFAVSRELGAARDASLFAALWFCATLFRGYTNYAGMNDPHLLGLALMTLAFYVFLAGRETRWVYGAFALFVVAGLIKNSLFALPLAAVCILFVERNERRYKILLFSAACVAACVGLLYRLYGDNVFTQIFMARTIVLWRIVGSFQRIQWIAVPLLFWLYAYRALSTDVARYVTAALIVSAWMVWWGTGVAEGVGTNAIFELVFASSVALACAASSAFDKRWKVLGRVFYPRDLVLALIVARLLASFDFAPYALLSDSSYRAEIARRVNGMEADIAFVKAIHGRAACSVMTVCYLAGKPYDLKAPPLILRGEDRWSPKS